MQIAKDPGFTIIVLDTGAFAPASPDHLPRITLLAAEPLIAICHRRVG